ncbi:O-antigen ligase family protein [Granulosicoccaceae sp. 1_MG-2023]|nr:O-antigen ligase family protein [Granulosicoccaceae sp. 1_MG-2023]
MKKNSTLVVHRIRHSDFSQPRSGMDGRVFLNDAPTPTLKPVAPGIAWAVGIALTLLTCMTAVDDSVSLYLFYGFCLAGLLKIAKDGLCIPFSEAEKTGFALLAVFFLVSLLSYWINQMPGKGGIYVEGRHGKFLFAILAYLFFRSVYLPDRVIWISAAVSAVFYGIVGLIDLNTVGGFGWPGRASLNTHPIFFGMISLSMGMLLLCYHDFWSQRPGAAWLARLAILGALGGLLMSGSRSVWLALPPMVVIYLVSRRHDRLRIRHVLKAVGAVLLACVLLYQLPFVNQRWHEAAAEYSGYMASENANDPVRGTSLGNRLEMWRAALRMIAENPLLGVGPGGYQVTATRYVEEGGWAPRLQTRNGPHNQYLQAWAARGLPGLLSTVLLMLAPVVYVISLRRRHPALDLRALSLSVMMIVTVFAVTGLSDDSLQKKPLIVFYCTWLALLLGQARHRTQD